jgi:hypothetical protein
MPSHFRCRFPFPIACALFSLRKRVGQDEREFEMGQQSLLQSHGLQGESRYLSSISCPDLAVDRRRAEAR